MRESDVQQLEALELHPCVPLEYGELILAG
jgi:hypothetical protein